MIPVVLTIAGSDSGGGAGIQADLKTFHAFGCFGTTAITAVTAQDTRGVRGVHRVPVETVVAQVRAVAEDLRPSACKSGMLGTGEAVRAVAAALDRHRLPRYVLDPVMVATSGDRLLDREGERAVLDELVPRAAVVTPNLDEASLLVGFPVRDVESMARAAEALVSRGARAALVKGGHLESDALVDLLWDGAEWREWRRPRLATRNTHGTGCTLSAAIAAGLARGHDLPRAVGDALDYVRRAIEAAPGLGSGHGPLNHMVTGGA
ncbi:bifunctional hydroxymethylpyrimidine kinase/phosphomethylpyrimidine kinase [Myxococcota bacterium]|nr:bifunctional hydroxymethylpyrimidine kinase/phosphomethylpyrimidine kinase [Myxococcota bacterium]